MNAIRATQQLNKRELENATPPSASWHVDYRDTAYIYVGGLHLDLTEGDVAIIFSQFGNPTHLNLIRDKETGKSKGFAFVKYEDQRSCDLAVDNLGGAEVLGRMLRVDHSRYKKRDDEDEDSYRLERLEAAQARAEGGPGGGNSSDETGGEDGGGDGDDEERRRKRRKRRRLIPLREEQELQDMLAITQDGEEQDPMREYLIKEKREEVERARERERRNRKSHRHHHHHRRREGEDDDNKEGDESGRGHHRHRDRNRHDDDQKEDRGDSDAEEKRRRKDQEGHHDKRKDAPRRRDHDDDSSRRQQQQQRSRFDDDRERKSSRPHRSRRDDDFD